MPPVGKAAQKATERLSKFLFGPARLIGPEDLAPRISSPPEAAVAERIPKATASFDVLEGELLVPTFHPRAAEQAFELEAGQNSVPFELAEGMTTGGAERIAKAYRGLSDLPTIVIGEEALQPRDIGRLLGRLTVDPELVPVIDGVMQRSTLIRRLHVGADRDLLSVSPRRADTTAGEIHFTAGQPMKALVGALDKPVADFIPAHELAHVLFGITEPRASAKTLLQFASMQGLSPKKVMQGARNLQTVATRRFETLRVPDDGEVIADALAYTMVQPKNAKLFGGEFIEALKILGLDPRYKSYGVKLASVAPLVLASGALLQSEPTKFDLRSERERSGSNE